MTQNRPDGGPANPRLSRRQERIAARGARRSGISRAATPRPRHGGIAVWTGVAVAIAAIVIGAAFLFSKTGGASTTSAPIAPGIVTPANVAASGRTLGQAGAPVTIDLYSDFRCTACFSFYSKAEPQVVSDLVATGKARLVYHDFLTIDSLDAHNGVTTTASRDAASAGLCAADKGAFWKYHDWLFANQDPAENPAAFSKDKLIAIAKAAGIDDAAFEACVTGGTHDAEVAAEQSSAPAVITGTPAVFVGGTPLTPGYVPSYADIAAAVEAKLSASPGPSASAKP